MAKPVRADQLLVTQGLAETPARGQALILAGLVFSGERRVEKSGDTIAPGIRLTVRQPPHPWVSRGGQKLDHALTHFGWDISGDIVIDIGASTGGFTDVALTRGAAKIYAVDVGHGQLAWKLQTDPRVIVLDKTNARYLTAAEIADPVDLLVCDASFISLKTILPAAMALSKPLAKLIALIKPQFEAGKHRVGPGGIVRDPGLHAEICADIETWMNNQPHWQVAGITQSPITGPDGNIEFLVAAEKSAS
jgi:23S rRNA (cytidine1920-2'-O)/16S rRNA (cytidine1409-2'-O)-methyltransferase